ncbi:protein DETOXIFICATION 43 isoform X3 [Euphorbia lathyris]|uniref:protein DETOXIFICATION 43 isoform X3 n=1 Tax=Euphorbia lathyris TaxID=212925 RepID=UPI0033135651
MAENGALQLATTRKWRIPLLIFFKDARNVFKMDEIGVGILRIAVPAAMALAADPVASLIDTAFIGHLGAVEIAAVGVSIAIFNQASKVTILPLVNITTSFVAEEDTVQRNDQNSAKKEVIEKGFVTINDEEKGKRHIPSASTALICGGILGLLQAILLIFCAKPLLSIMGVKSDSPMITPARKYLTLRALGSPAVLLSLAMQGVFRGFKDTKTPLYATIIGDVTNVILDPIFIFICGLGVSGAAIAHVLSQYLMSLILLWRLMKEVDLLPPTGKDLQFRRFLKNGFLLLVRVIAATICVTLAASRAARLGPTPMAAFQVCLQVWMTSSLLADGLAVAAQAIIASAFAEKDYQKATTTATRVLQMSFFLGLGLAVVVGFVAGTQPINSIAFVFDGVNYGASDFTYSAYSMVLVAIASIGSIFVLFKAGGFVGIWVALTIFMGLRTFAGVWRMGTGTGPWRFLRC